MMSLFSHWFWKLLCVKPILSVFAHTPRIAVFLINVAKILVQNQYAKIVYKPADNDDCKFSCPVFHCKNSRVHR